MTRFLHKSYTFSSSQLLQTVASGSCDQQQSPAVAKGPHVSVKFGLQPCYLPNKDWRHLYAYCGNCVLFCKDSLQDHL